MSCKGEILYDSSTVNSDLLYKVGVFVPDPFLYFKVEDKEYVVVKSLEYGRVKEHAKSSINVLLPEDVIEGKSSSVDEKALIKAVIEKYRIEEFRVPEKFPVYLADHIRSLNVNLDVVAGDFYPDRICKYSDEVINIREAARGVEYCMSRVEDILREATVDGDGNLIWNNNFLTSEILHKEVNIAAVKKNATAVDTIAASGIDGSQPHNVGSGIIKEGEPIVVDIFPRMNKTGYWGDMTRTFVKGTAPEIVKQAYKAVFAAKKVAIDAMKAGVKASDMHSLAKTTLEEHGFLTGRDDSGEYYGFFHSLGHGVGLDIHEAPLLGLSNNKDLKENSVVTVEPGVYYKEWGGIRLEDMVLVKKDGVEIITDYPEVLEIS